MGGFLGVGCLGLAASAPAITRWLLELPVSVVLGKAPAVHYSKMLRATSLSWSLLIPLLFVLSVALLKLLSSQLVRPGFGPSRSTIVVCVGLVLVAGTLVPRQPTGDEPAYLIMTNSLIRDGDFQSPEAGPEFHPSPCARPGVAVSKHPPGMAVLLATPVLLAGETGARLGMALLGVVLIALLIPLLETVVEPTIAAVTALLLGISFPVAPFSGLLFPDLPAAACLALVASRLVGLRVPLWSVAAALGLLPWLNPRMLPPAVLILLWSWLDRHVPRRTALALSASLAASLSGMAWLHVRWFGSPSPFAARWCSPHLLQPSQALVGTLGILVDQQYGLLVWAPMFCLVPVGLALLWRRNRSTTVGLVLLVGATCGPGVLHNWTAGWSPAGRYLVPALPFLAIPVALAARDGLRRAGWRGELTRLLVIAQLLIGALALTVPGKLFGTLDTNPWNYYLSLAGRVLHLDPRFVLPSLRNGPPLLGEAHAAALLGLLVTVSWVWLRGDRVSGAPAAEERGRASASDPAEEDGRSSS